MFLYIYYVYFSFAQWFLQVKASKAIRVLFVIGVQYYIIFRYLCSFLMFCHFNLDANFCAKNIENGGTVVIVIRYRPNSIRKRLQLKNLKNNILYKTRFTLFHLFYTKCRGAIVNICWLWQNLFQIRIKSSIFCIYKLLLSILVPTFIGTYLVRVDDSTNTVYWFDLWKWHTNIMALV